MPLDRKTDLQVVQRVLAGDQSAREELIDTIGCLPAVVRVRARRSGRRLSADEIDDATQNVLLALWRKLDQFDGRVPLLIWAQGFVAIELTKTVERRLRRSQRFQQWDVEPSTDASEPTFDSELLTAALAREPEPDVGLLRLKLSEGLTFEELGARVGMHPNTVKTRYYRCLERLRRRLRQGGESR